MKKTIKTISKIVLILLAIVGAIFIAVSILIFYLMENPEFYNKVLTQKAKNLIPFCQRQKVEKQNECFTIVATAYKYNDACNFAPNKKECTDLIGSGKIDFDAWKKGLDDLNK